MTKLKVWRQGVACGVGSTLTVPASKMEEVKKKGLWSLRQDVKPGFLLLEIWGSKHLRASQDRTFCCGFPALKEGFVDLCSLWSGESSWKVRVISEVRVRDTWKLDTLLKPPFTWGWRLLLWNSSCDVTRFAETNVTCFAGLYLWYLPL